MLRRSLQACCEVVVVVLLFSYWFAISGEITVSWAHSWVKSLLLSVSLPCWHFDDTLLQPFLRIQNRNAASHVFWRQEHTLGCECHLLWVGHGAVNTNRDSARTWPAAGTLIKFPFVPLAKTIAVPEWQQVYSWFPCCPPQHYYFLLLFGFYLWKGHNSDLMSSLCHGFLC